MNHNAIAESPSIPFRPLKRLVFIKPEIEERRGSIFLARMSRQMPDKGTIIAMSSEAEKYFNGEAKVGDRVIFKKQQQFLADDQQCTVIDCDFVLGVL